MSTATTYARFIIQALISLIAVSVSTAMIFKDFDKQKVPFTVGVSLLTAVIGYWTPTPKKPKSTEDKRAKYRAYLKGTKGLGKKKSEQKRLKELIKEKKRELKEEARADKLAVKEKALEVKERLLAEKAQEAIEKKRSRQQAKLDQLRSRVSKNSLGDTVVEMEEKGEDEVDFGTLDEKLTDTLNKIEEGGVTNEASGESGEKKVPETITTSKTTEPSTPSSSPPSPSVVEEKPVETAPVDESDSPSEKERQLQDFKGDL